MSQWRAEEIQTAIHKILSDTTKLKQVKQAVEKFKEEYNKHANEEIRHYYLPFTIHVPKELLADETKLQNLFAICRARLEYQFNRPHVYTYLTTDFPPHICTDIVFYEHILDYLRPEYVLFSRIKLNFDTKRYLTRDRSVYLVVPDNKIDLAIRTTYCPRAYTEPPYKPPRQRIHSASILEDDKLNGVSEHLSSIQEIIAKYVRLFNMHMLLRTMQYTVNCRSHVGFTVNIPIQIYNNEQLVLELAVEIEIGVHLYNAKKGEYRVEVRRSYYVSRDHNTSWTLGKLTNKINFELSTGKVRQEQVSKHLRMISLQTIWQLGFNPMLLEYGLRRLKFWIGTIHASELVPIHTGIVFVLQIRRPRIITIDDISRFLRIVRGVQSEAVYLDRLDLFAIDYGDIADAFRTHARVDDSSIEAIQYKI